METSRNPYSPGAGAPPPELAGREGVLESAGNAIVRAKAGRAPKALMVLGLRGVGKTVLLNEFEKIAEANGSQTALVEAVANQSLAEMLTPQLQRILLKLNRLQRVGHELQRAFGLLRSFASVFKVRVGELEFGASNEPVTGDLSLDLTDLFVAIGEAAKARNTVIAILIDEVQYLTQEDLSALIVALHKISQRRLPLVFFGAGLPQLAKLAGDAKSYAERLFEYPPIGPLDSESARRALVEPARSEGAEFSDDALEHILEQTRGYPFFLQVWGAHAWDAAKLTPINAADAKAATTRAIAGLDEGIFKSRFERMTERQRQYARAMAEFGAGPANSTAVAELLGMNVKQAGPVRDELIKKGMAYSPNRGDVAFTIPLFDEFMRRRMAGPGKGPRAARKVGGN
ncbi:MAG TPA: AAA family ATPase [Hyphomonadaceae bacterium]|nr:AAA family ATPase [Hyphomonadaceae bacterium]